MTLAMLIVLLATCTALADHTIIIAYPKDRKELAYGPSTYHKKTSTQQHWDITYNVGPTQHPEVEVYLYDKELGDRGTHIESINMYESKEFSWLGRSGKVGNNYKVVMIAPSKPPTPNNYKFTWLP